MSVLRSSTNQFVVNSAVLLMVYPIVHLSQAAERKRLNFISQSLLTKITRSSGTRGTLALLRTVDYVFITD